MGRRRKVSTGSLSLILGVAGIIPQIDDEAAIKRAQNKNAEIALATVKGKAYREVSNQGDNRSGTKDYPGQMAEYYFADVDERGDIILGNPTDRAHFFEHGTPPHVIEATGLQPVNQERMARGQRPRGRRGQFSRGTQALAFPGPDGTKRFADRVDHPGQLPNPIAYESLEENLDTFAENIADEIEREWEGQ